MKRHYLLDTGAVTDYLNKREPTLTRARTAIGRGARLGICPPVLGELYLGIELSDTPDRTRRLLTGAFRTLYLWPFDKAAAKQYGRIHAVLTRIGRPMQQVDMQVAAVAFALRNCVVVTKDSDLSAIPGLNVEDWSKEETA
jgi:tRNA(fMet)-specific endonuclease VapC